MNREIKFRGKRVDNNEWIVGDLVHNAFDGTSKTLPVAIQRPKCYPVEVIPETVGQYTGLKDKNVNEIYEGDVVEGYWGWMSGDGRLKKGFPNKIRKHFEVKYKTREGNAGFKLNEIRVHPDDQFAADKYFYRAVLCHLSENREPILKDNKTIWKGKCESLEIISNIHDNSELIN